MILAMGKRVAAWKQRETHTEIAIRGDSSDMSVEDRAEVLALNWMFPEAHVKRRSMCQNLTRFDELHPVAFKSGTACPLFFLVSLSTVGDYSDPWTATIAGMVFGVSLALFSMTFIVTMWGAFNFIEELVNVSVNAARHLNSYRKGVADTAEFDALAVLTARYIDAVNTVSPRLSTADTVLRVHQTVAAAVARHHLRHAAVLVRQLHAARDAVEIASRNGDAVLAAYPTAMIGDLTQRLEECFAAAEYVVERVEHEALAVTVERKLEPLSRDLPELSIPTIPKAVPW